MKNILLIITMALVSCDFQESGNSISESSGIPDKSITLWSDKTELFVEFPALVVGNTSRFAAHFTVLEGHQPVREGAVTVSLIKGEQGIRNTVQSPSSPGIFTPSLQPKEAGNYKLIFDLKTPSYSDQIIIHDIIVYPTENAALNALGLGSESGGITFLKEQAWKIDFQTMPVIQGEIYNIINTSGVWKATTGSTKTIAATANGSLDFALSNFTEGIAVKKGQLLMNISSKALSSGNLQLEIKNAKLNYEQLKASFLRKKELYASKIISKTEFETLEKNYLIAKSDYEIISEGVSESGKQIRTPFDGFIKRILVSNGSYVNQGMPLVVIGPDHSTVLESKVSPSYLLTMDNVQEVWYKSIQGNWVNVADEGGAVLSIGKDITLDNPLVSVFTFVNKKITMPNGSLTEVQIAMGNSQLNTMISSSALLEDYGSYSVIVQLTGESFERRPVKIGKRNGKNVEILDGLEVGEVVITQGAYQVKMASMSGETPAHGHEH